MKIITATGKTQGRRPNDFDWCIEGEIVMPPITVCRRDRNNPDGGCGCGRAWAGANSHRSTTTAMVRDVKITIPDYFEALRSSLEQQEWWPDPVDNYDLVAMANELLTTAEHYPAGAVLERRLDVVVARMTS